MLAGQGLSFRQGLDQRQGLGLLDDIGSDLTHWPATEVARAASSMAIRASGRTGFDISVIVLDRRYILTFGDWTEEFEDAATAHRLIAAAIDGTARLKVDALAGRQWRWTLECLDKDDRWVAESTIGRVIWRFWGQPSTIYLRNVFARRPV